MVSLLNLVGSTLARLALAIGVRKQVTLQNLTAAFPGTNKRSHRKLLADTYSNLGRVFAEFLFLRFASREQIAQRLRITNPEVLHNALARNRGLILLSAHLANWEWMAMATGIHLGRPLHVIVKNQTGSFAERFLQTMRSRFGNIMVNAGDPRAIFRALQKGEVVAILADQSAPAESVSVNFFGRKVPTFEGPARFAIRTGAPLFLAECVREAAGKYTMTFHEVPSGDLAADESGVAELTRRHVQALEEIIRKRPELWLWQHKRWKNAVA